MSPSPLRAPGPVRITGLALLAAVAVAVSALAVWSVARPGAVAPTASPAVAGRPTTTATALAAPSSGPVAPSAATPGSSEPRPPAPVAGPPIRIGAVFPFTGDAAPLAEAELRGVQMAADAVNAAGGVDGRPIELDVRELDSAADADEVLASLQAAGAAAVVGTYSSALSIPVSAAAAARGLVYWESGAVADQLTGRGLPLVFRVGASGSNLGTNSADFAASELAARLGKPARDLRIAIVSADDDYATSVAAAADRAAGAAGMRVVADDRYHLAAPRFGALMRSLAKARPDVLILASHIPDGIAFRRAMLAVHLRVGALIGTTMAECVPDFAIPLGRDVVGIFGSDRPAGGFDPESLTPEAYAVYEQFEDAWKQGAAAGTLPAGGTNPADGGGWSASPAPSSPAETPGSSDWSGGSALEEALAGFTAGWALFHDVLPTAATSGSLDAASIATAARAVDLPAGSLPNGAGLRFSTDPATLGQNERAIGMIWQWQAPGTDVVVWPKTFATGPIAFVPLPR